MITRLYGEPPYHLVVLHGGPGACGDGAPLAKELSDHFGISEPILTGTTIEHQMDDLKESLLTNGYPPFILIGHSWGAMLAFIFTARHPDLVKKLILISSGVFEQNYAASITSTLLDRMTDQERVRVKNLETELLSPDFPQKNKIFCELGKASSIADSYDLMDEDFQAHSDTVQGNFETYVGIWPQLQALRSSRELLDLGKHIQCPVIAIHGTYDSHLAAGVKEPLSQVLKDFRFILLDNCGHYPWFERQAKKHFFDVLRRELTNDIP